MDKSIEVLKRINWSMGWAILKDIIIPHIGTVIWNIFLFFILSVILALVYIRILHKKKVFKRKPKYYNWIVKLYIPLLFIGIIYIFAQFALLHSVKLIIDKEREGITNSVYNKTLKFYFDTEENKNEFVKKIQKMSIEIEEGQIKLINNLEEKAKTYNTGINIIDHNKNKISNYLIEKYGSDIYKMALYGMLNAAGKHINITEDLPYDQFSTGIDFLSKVGHKDIEKMIKENLDTWLSSVITSQYHKLLKSTLILLILIMIIPLLEFFIYKQWIEQ